jgi:uncharacterized protein YfkK (UPF0435 family)
MADQIENKADEIIGNVGSDNETASNLFDEAYGNMSSEDFSELTQNVESKTNGDNDRWNNVYSQKDEFGQIQSIYINDGYVWNTKLFDTNESKHIKPSDGDNLYDRLLKKETPSAQDLTELANRLGQLAKTDPERFIQTVKVLKEKTTSDWNGSGNDIQVEFDDKGKIANISINDGIFSDTELYSTQKSLTDVYNGIKKGYNTLNDALGNGK